MLRPWITCCGWLWLLAGLVLAGRAEAQTAPVAHWASSWGTAGDDRHTHIARDGVGNAFTAGWTQPAPAQPLRLNVLKHDAQGQQLWAQQWSCAGGTIEPWGIAVDGSGNVWVAGLFGEAYWGTPGVAHTVTFGTTTLTATNRSSEIFLVKFDPAGQVLWARQTQSAFKSICSGLAVDAAGNAYLTGTTDQNARFGALTVSTSGNGQLAFVARYDAQGDAKWVQAVGNGELNKIAVDAAGTCCLAGAAHTSFTLGGVPITAVFGGAPTGFLARLDAQGQVLWARQLPSPAALLAVTPSGAIWTAQQITAPVTYGSQAFVPVGRDDVLCLSFSAQGAYQWGRQFGGGTTTIGNSDSPLAVTVDAAGNSYFVLGLLGLITLTQPSGLTNYTQFLVSLSPTGTTRWARSMLAGGAQAVTVAAADDLWVAGAAYSPVRFDGINLTCQGPSDGYTARLGDPLSAPTPTPPTPTPPTPTPPTPTPPTPTSPTPGTVFIPNVFTPNGDGHNDTFAPANLPAGAWQLHIYSRWGRLVYQTANYQSDWSAEGLAAGLYYYRLEATGQLPYQGWVEVVR
ncbi:gliding motility-associated C-terminal domain-containing protein [Hymenobacter bucti]|uniref:Gliding motility-associated C-terminal domain-containing protein n=1 Tax=Hymenobacter bucti TaxID=1844114 RepID=A0ABW4R197_9BACT